MSRRQWIAVALVLVALGVGASRLGWQGTEARQPTVPGALEVTAPILKWCAEGLEAIPGGGCFAPAAQGTPRPAPILVYLHGRFEHAAPQGELERQRRVAQHATARGFSVLALRGREGQCLQPELASWVCWPASERTVDAGADIVAGWAAARREVAARTGNGTLYVLGFSSGAFFAVILATRGLVDATAFAIAGGGPIEPTRAEGMKPPILLLSADDDPSQPGMIQLDEELTREKWPHDTFARAGGHDLLDPDVDAALTFFKRVRTEPLPLRPPLSTHVARVHAAGGDDGAAAIHAPAHDAEATQGGEDAEAP